MKKGMSVMEIIVVVAIIAVLFAVSMQGFNNFRNKQAIKTSAEVVASYLNKARTNTIASLNDSRYGVHLETDKITLFVGDIYSSGVATNEMFSIPNGVSISIISLNGGGSDVLFNKISGETSNYGSVTISLNSDSFQNILVSVSESGIVSIE